MSFEDDIKARAQREVMPKLLEKIGILVMDKAKELVPKDIGTLRDRIYYRVEGNKVRIFNELPYAEVYEYGRAPGTMPPVAPIEVWAKRHGMEGAGWAIAKNIKKRGIKAGTVKSPRKTQSGSIPFLRPAVFQSRDTIAAMIKKEFGVN